MLSRARRKLGLLVSRLSSWSENSRNAWRKKKSSAMSSSTHGHLVLPYSDRVADRGLVPRIFTVEIFLRSQLASWLFRKFDPTKWRLDNAVGKIQLFEAQDPATLLHYSTLLSLT